MNVHSLPLRRRARVGFGSALRSIARTLVERLLTWQEAMAERQRLAELDDRQLRDIGLSRADIERELRRPLWDSLESRWRPW